jgi:hypothetical protein
MTSRGIFRFRRISSDFVIEAHPLPAPGCRLGLRFRSGQCSACVRAFQALHFEPEPVQWIACMRVPAGLRQRIGKTWPTPLAKPRTQRPPPVNAPCCKALRFVQGDVCAKPSARGLRTDFYDSFQRGHAQTKPIAVFVRVPVFQLNCARVIAFDCVALRHR